MGRGWRRAGEAGEVEEERDRAARCGGGSRERGSEERGGSLRMAGATAYEGAARAEGADTVVGRRAGAARGGGNMAAGQSVSNRRAERSSYAESRARRRTATYNSAPLRTVTLRPLAVVDTRGHAHHHPRRAPSGLWRPRAPHLDGSPGVPSPRRRRPRRRRRHRRRCQFRLSRPARSPGHPRGGQPVIPEPR